LVLPNAEIDNADSRLRGDDDRAFFAAKQPSGFVAVGYATTGEVVGRHFDRDTVAFENADAKAAELAGYCREHRGSVVERYTKRGARQDFSYGPFEFNQVFFGDTVL
jgi:hypothetical protein